MSLAKKPTKAAARRALTTVDNELRTHLETTIGTLATAGMIAKGHLPEVWALDIQTRDGVKVRFESSRPATTVTGSTLPAIRDLHPRAPDSSSALIKKVTGGQQSNIHGKREQLGITEIVVAKSSKYPTVQPGVYQLSDEAIKSLNQLDGTLPRETASAIITALESVSA